MLFYHGHVLQLSSSFSPLGHLSPHSYRFTCFSKVSLKTLVVLYVSLELVPVCFYLYLRTCVCVCVCDGVTMVPLSLTSRGQRLGAVWSINNSLSGDQQCLFSPPSSDKCPSDDERVFFTRLPRAQLSEIILNDTVPIPSQLVHLLFVLMGTGQISA